jgi:hypothetical protein
VVRDGLFSVIVQAAVKHAGNQRRDRVDETTI